MKGLSYLQHYVKTHFIPDFIPGGCHIPDTPHHQTQNPRCKKVGKVKVSRYRWGKTKRSQENPGEGGKGPPLTTVVNDGVNLTLSEREAGAAVVVGVEKKGN